MNSIKKKKIFCRKCTFHNNRIKKLRIKIKELQCKLDELCYHPSIIAGLQGEELVVKIAKGAKSKRGMPYDITLRNGDKVEIKYSRPNWPGHQTARWTWHRVLGEKGKGKDYKFLVLIGEKPESYQNDNKDESMYTYFLLKRMDVKKVVDSADKRGHINFIVKPIYKTWSRTREKLLKFKRTRREMNKIFRQLVIKKT